VSRLRGKVALVTGASRGIGRMVADRLEAEGAVVAALARTLERRRTPTRLELPCDVAREDDVTAAVTEILDTFGAPDIVINNAGTFLLKPIEETTDAEFREQIAVNTVGAFHVLRALVPALREKRGAHLVTIGSVADHHAYVGNAAYAASKFAARGLHEVVRAELKDCGVRTTLVSPGPTDTRLWDAIDPAAAARVPPRHSMLHPADVAEAVLYAVTQPPRVAIEWIRLMPAPQCANRET
jgi:NADP-dependent 3-hydroxy acid dehydrogenase YdfG